MQAKETRRLALAFVYSSRAHGRAMPLESMLRPDVAETPFTLDEGDIDFLIERLRVSDPDLGARLVAHANLPEPDATRFNERMVTDGVAALRAVSAGKRPQQLNRNLQSALEAIVRATGRPSILIRNGKLASIPPEWDRLALSFHSEQIETAILSVGRIELRGHPENMKFVGTGWMAGEDVLVTNRHVVNLFGTKNGQAWAMKHGITASVNFLAEDGSTMTNAFSVTGIIGVHEDSDIDLALLRIARTGEGGEKIPQPMAIEARTEAAAGGACVYAIGYPGFDMRHGDIEDEIFDGIYNRKRFAPGEIMALDTEKYGIEHDCSTLKGSSGSCLVSLDTHRVLGLHYSGDPFVANRAVWLATVKNDPLIKRASLNFK